MSSLSSRTVDRAETCSLRSTTPRSTAAKFRRSKNSRSTPTRSCPRSPHRRCLPRSYRACRPTVAWGTDITTIRSFPQLVSRCPETCWTEPRRMRWATAWRRKLLLTGSTTWRHAERSPRSSVVCSWTRPSWGIPRRFTSSRLLLFGIATYFAKFVFCTSGHVI